MKTSTHACDVAWLSDDNWTYQKSKKLSKYQGYLEFKIRYHRHSASDPSCGTGSLGRHRQLQMNLESFAKPKVVRAPRVVGHKSAVLAGQRASCCSSAPRPLCQSRSPPQHKHKQAPRGLIKSHLRRGRDQTRQIQYPSLSSAAISQLASPRLTSPHLTLPHPPP